MKRMYSIANKMTTKNHLWFNSTLLLIFLFAIVSCNNSPTTASNKTTLPTDLVNNPHTANGVDPVAAAMKPTMDFQDSVHDFGKIHENEVIEHDFNFTNNGKTALIITSATGTCGCTVADYPHDPIQPGKSAIMKVTFNSAGKTGHQAKSVVIHTNTLQSTKMLHITADIDTK